ncbi:hypothetical protein [Rhizobium leguminosarum]|uniref:hypothetical protein n=1 Tax=Rhizobium leguminosarum TaxID=384 RepID=UPI001C91BDBA|nr:hypothetical protein [Rhizobium leguminosarum]MBY3044217.1 hypothetical protein [Rhizobium leguminosarum]
MITPLACYLTTNDHAILQEILDQDLRDNAYRRLLGSKLLQAAICPPFRVPDDAVTIGSSVTFCLNGGAARTAYLVQNESRDFPVYTVSVKSILGLGIIGMRAGRTINIETDIGWPQRIDVLRLDFQAPASVSGSSMQAPQRFRDGRPPRDEPGPSAA